MVPAHFEGLKARLDQRLQWEAQQAITNATTRLPLIQTQGPEVERRPLTVYEGMS